MSDDAIQHARIDAAGALLAADPLLADLNKRAGGRVGAPVAVPQIASIVRLARKLRVVVSRAAIAADDDDEVDLWVRAAPDGEDLALTVSSWVRRPRRQPPTGQGEEKSDHPDADWSWATDEALRLTSLSPTVAGLLGADIRPLVGAPLTQLFSFVEDGQGGMPILIALAERRRFDDQFALLRGLDPARYRLRAVPMIDGRGRFAGFQGAAARLDERTPAPEAIDDGAFAARLDDALREPLGRIIANADDLQAQIDGPLRADYATYAADIAVAGRHLLSLVDDLVDLQAIERPDFRPESDPIDLADLARRAGGLLAVRAAARQVRVERPAPGETVPAIGEFRRVLQILVNLIGNAVRYSPADGVVLIEARREGTFATIVVADEGRGIAPEDQERIFAKFERIDLSEPGGTGLGLYIARRLARVMGGDLTVSSAPGKGARFTLTLPTA